MNEIQQQPLDEIAENVAEPSLPEETKPPKQQSVAKSAGIVSIAVMFSRLLGLVREMVFARFFGAGFLFDAYQVAFTLPNVLRDLFAEGALSAAAVKVFTETEINEGEEAANKLASLLFNVIAVVLSLVTLIGVIFSKQIVGIVAGSFSPEKAALTITMTQIMFPFILLVALAAIAMGILNTRGNFGVPASASTVFNVASIIAGLGFAYWLSGGHWEKPLDKNVIPDMPAQWAIIGMAIGTLIGGAAQFFMQVPSLYKIGFRFSLAFNLADEGLKKVMYLMAPAIIGTSAVQINVLVNTFLVTHIDGGRSWVSYAFRLMQFPIGLFGVAVGTASVPALSRLAVKENLTEFRRTLTDSLKLVFLMTIPSACGLIVLGEPIIRLIYERGAFSSLDVSMTAWALVGYSAGLLGYAGIKIVSPAFYALNDSKTPMTIALISIVVNAVAGYLFVRFMSNYDLGHVGATMATSTVGLSNFFMLAILMRRKIKHLNGREIISSFLRIGIASAIMSVACWFSYQGLLKYFGNDGFMLRLIEAFVPIGIGGIFFFAAAKLLKVEEVDRVYRIFARKFGRT
jgi:putative peptidoglycan lipid II flippase